MRPVACRVVEVTGYLPVANNFPGSFFWRGLGNRGCLIDFHTLNPLNPWKPGANGSSRHSLAICTLSQFLGENVDFCGYNLLGNTENRVISAQRCAMMSIVPWESSDYRNFKEWICCHALLVMLNFSNNAPTETSDGLYAVAFSFALDLTPSTWMLDRSACR